MKFKALLIAVPLMVLSSCGAVDEPEKPEPKKTEYDSKIVYSVSGDLSENEIGSLAEILSERVKDGEFTGNYEVISDSKNNTVTVEFNYNADLTDNLETFMEISAERNLLEFRKGTEPDGELILTGRNIVGAETQCQTSDGTAFEYVVAVDFDEEGASRFEDATGELAGTDIPIAMWLNDEIIMSPHVITAITDGKAVISGNFDLKEAENLAAALKSEPMPYDVEITDYKFAKE